MKFFSSLTSGLRLLGLTVALLGASSVRADVSSYLIDINTASIANDPSGPFSLDLQSLFGSGNDQTITVSNFVVTGGNFNGSATGIGAVAGDTSSSITFNPSSSNFYNEFFKQFDAGVTDIKFLLTLTTNASGATPTSFAAAILDSSLLNIATNGVGDSLLLFNIDGTNTSFQTATGSGVVVTVASIPEPSTYALMTGAAALLVALRRRRAGKAENQALAA